ncbi:CapA family protein [Marinithermus hydrothermalis]|uniref:Capsule synthesis protein, CapA n=1 Tax=Marinithermus hydrothermalis (strain DSM 14884 / JCM 11576 / T1) TaxID=869210 RepID=F2NP74_MARHT|nr:CapA family protein [Marinithermus hydrothermalis]AEB11875.1 Capsule synthesis protein, CapA [Marinithermus hydrothermalis DSM 14884]
MLGGDAMLGRGVARVIATRGPAHPLGTLSPLTRQADLFGVNLECAVSARPRVYRGPKKAFYFRAPPAALEALTHAGVGLVTLANNHALDADLEGLGETLQALEARGFAHAGAGAHLEAARAPAVLEVRGVRIGIIACCDHQPDFAARPARPGTHYVNPHDPKALARLLQGVADLAERVDHVIVSYHWQANWVPAPAPVYRTLGHSLLEAGARVVWGHGPHHFQGVEWAEGGVILYATGDLLDDYAVHPHFRNDRQLLFEVELTPQGPTAVRAYPLVLEFGRTWFATGPEQAWILERFAEACRIVKSRVEAAGPALRVLP